MLATHFTLSLDQVPTPDDLLMKLREYLLINPWRRIVTAFSATTVEQILARIPAGINLVMTWIRGDDVRIVVRWNTMFQPLLFTNKM